MSENQIQLENHLLVCIQVNVAVEDLEEYRYLKSHFCGRVLYAHKEDLGTMELAPRTQQGIVFVCGDIQLLRDKKKHVLGNVKIIKRFSFNTEGIDGLEYVPLGEVSAFDPNEESCIC